MDMIEIKNLKFGYKRSRLLYDNLSFSLRPGHICGLLGENGVGKSTLLYLICGALHPLGGSVRFHGADAFCRRPGQLADLFLLPEEFEVPDVKLRSYLGLYAPFYPRFSYEQMRACLEAFGLPWDCRLAALSMGQRKKVQISFALAANTSLLLMDEPTNGLDIPGKSVFRQLVARNMSDERSILVSTHQVADVGRMLDEVLILDSGGVRLDATVEEVCRALQFVANATGEEAAAPGVLYSQPSAGGYGLVLPNGEGTESRFDLELLFNAVRKNPAVVEQIEKKCVDTNAIINKEEKA